METQNTSGQGPDSIIPKEIQWFNWYAQFYGSTWAIKQGIAWDKDLLKRATSFLYWGQHGNELAWRAKRWESVEVFNAEQQRLSSKGKSIYISLMILGLFIVIGGITLSIFLKR